MPHPRPAARAAIPLLLLATAACAARPEPPVSTPAAPAMDESHEHHAVAAPASAGPGYTAADVLFMQGMIGHHAQALVMAALAPSRGASEPVLQLARKIDISQRDEIAMMRSWLEERGQPAPDEAHGGHGAHASMPGMLTDAQLAELRAASGREFDRLFLTFMIGHHRGALAMVEELFRTPRAGQDPDLFRFVTDVDADQRDEIFAMQRVLDALASSI